MIHGLHGATVQHREQRGNPVDMINKVAEYTARNSVQNLARPIEIQSVIFTLKGRKESTRNARAALFDFEVRPGMVPQFKSWADIAREFGCTRTALSAAAKQLPAGLRGKPRVPP
jgi:hypothetical protein